MTDHLPECLLSTCVEPCACCVCICDRLRQAERRGFDNGRESITDEDRQNIHRIRQAVKALPSWGKDEITYVEWVDVDAVLSIIDGEGE